MLDPAAHHCVPEYPTGVGIRRPEVPAYSISNNTGRRDVRITKMTPVGSRTPTSSETYHKISICVMFSAIYSFIARSALSPCCTSNSDVHPASFVSAR